MSYPIMKRWEGEVPSLRNGLHYKLVNKAYNGAYGKNVFPPKEVVFDAIRLVPFEKVKVFILGQDPYINTYKGVPEAMGLCFSVHEGIPAPPSLKNIFKEIAISVYEGEKTQVFSTDLTRWAKQGVCLLNANLTVEEKKSNSHALLGWNIVTDDIINTISKRRKNLVFMLWGNLARSKKKIIELPQNHLILEAAHPSPLSAYRGFMGCNHFTLCNNYLQKKGLDPIKW